jgi:hypothetical protein
VYRDPGVPPIIPPISVSPLGLFVPAPPVAPLAPPPGILADLIDYGQFDPSKDPERPTFEYLSLRRGMHPIDEQVCIALTRVRASGAAVQNEGGRFLDIEKLDDRAKSRIVSEARIALKRLVTNRDIEIVSLSAEIDDDLATLLVQYKNLRAKDRSTVRRTYQRIPEWMGVAS